MSDAAHQLARRCVDAMMQRDRFSQWLGIEILETGPGQCKIRMTVRDEMVNGFDVTHGGIAFSLADSAFAFAANSYGTISVAIDNGIQYPAAVHPGDVLTAVAEERAASKRVAYYDVTVTNGDGKTVALFTGTVFRTGRPLLAGDERGEK